jgi:hypothetical protein
MRTSYGGVESYDSRVRYVTGLILLATLTFTGYAAFTAFSEEDEEPTRFDRWITDPGARTIRDGYLRDHEDR